MIKKRTIKDTIDTYLDIYNDYQILYKMFGDNYYNTIMEEAIYRLKEIVKYN